MARKSNTAEGHDSKLKKETGKPADDGAEETCPEGCAGPAGKSAGGKTADGSADGAAGDAADGAADCAADCAASDADGAAGDAAETADDPVAALEKNLTAERDKYLRLAAEYDNYRKRSVKERETVYSDARADAIMRLLPVYDNLERALKMECADEAFYKGVEMTMTQLTEILEGMNVKRIPAVGEPFDPNRHDAVMSIEDPELGEKIVAEECKTGFMLGERVIRHSTVVVAN